MNKSFHTSTSTILAFLLLLISPVIAIGQSWEKKVTPSLLGQTRDGDSAPFIIVMTQQADLSAAWQLRTKEAKGEYVYQSLQQIAQQSQKSIAGFFKANQIDFQSLYVINAIRAEGNADVIRSVASRHDVAKVMADPKVSFTRPVEKGVRETESRSAIEWGIERINADDVWNLGYTGQEVVVGGEDTGYEWDHPALILKYRGYNQIADTVDHNYNWHDAIHAPNPHHSDTINPCGYDSKEPCDDSGHGTHTMGTMVGGEGENQIGVAPDAQWCACRNMERGYGTPFTYIECFEWFLAPTDLNNENPDPSKAPHVINNSWGCPPIEGCDTSNFELMEMVVNNLRAAGIVVVVSAGNDGSDCSTVYTPAAIYEGSFSVGATRFNDTIAGYSSRGPVLVDGSNRLKPNVSAPGSGVRSSVPGGEYDFSSGTSMAGPHVAGLVALMISANPALAGQVELIEDIIETTAVPKTTDQQCGEIPGSEVPNNTYGYGRIDALAAVEAALALVETGVDEDPLDQKMVVYPNPFRDKLFIHHPSYLAKGTFTLFDMQGRVMVHQVLEESHDVLREINVDHLPGGFYLYQWSAGSTSHYGKLVKAE
jgi:subtilisin family serine protease